MISKVYNRLRVAADLPWFVAFSGGKDSTVVLDVAYRFNQEAHTELAVLHNEELLKPPPIFMWVYGTLSDVARSNARVVVTIPNDDYLTVIFEKRYSPPGPAFMWCTARFKERPTAKLAKMLSWQKYVLLTGVHMAESQRRSAYIKTRCKIGDVCGEAYVDADKYVKICE